MNSILRQKLENLPVNPGVYLFKDTKNDVIYVGKAKQLQHRVRSYFQKGTYHTGKIKAMVRNITELDVIVTDSEAEALILENNLIKKYRPRYNILYRDDKTYPYICVTNEERPRVFPTRSVIRDGSRYYGPYDHAGKMRLMLETIRKSFQFCTCACSSRMIDQSKGMPKWGRCFEDYFENCSAELPIETYRYKMDQVVRLLNGRTRELISELKEEMTELSEMMAFEKAALLRDGILALEKYSARMKVVSSDGRDRDVFALESEHEENVACGVLFQVREGKLVGRYHRYLRNIEGSDNPVLIQSFMEDYYTGERSGAMPDEVCCSNELSDDEPLFEYLWHQKNRKVAIIVPQRGDKAQLVQMAKANARLLLKEWLLEKERADQGRIPYSVQALERDLRLHQPPRRIECFDVSNFQGSYTVASMVCFVDGQPRKSEYKRFHINSVSGPDDFASMREVVRRRYSRIKNEGKQVPDLLMVDGGKGQLSSAIASLRDIDFSDKMPVIGLAKRLEEIFLPGSPEPVMIPKTSPSLKLLQRIRDEAHRFAINFHRDVRSKKTFRSELQEIPGIGVKTTEKLIRYYGSVGEIVKQDRQSLTEVAGAKAAESIFNYFHNA